MQYETITSKVSFPAPLHLDGASRSASFASLATMKGSKVCAHMAAMQLRPRPRP